MVICFFNIANRVIKNEFLKSVFSVTAASVLSSCIAPTDCAHHSKSLKPFSSCISGIIATSYCYAIWWLNKGTDHPSLSAAFTLTPKSSRNFTIWWWPAQTALWRGVIPSSLGMLGFSTLKTQICTKEKLDLAKFKDPECWHHLLALLSNNNSAQCHRSAKCYWGQRVLTV